jgi:plasmid maintenance system antidote protein VapI
MIEKLLSTGRIIAAYLEANNANIFDLATSSGVEAKTVYRLINDETKLSYKIAKGMHNLIPEISPEFLVSYDAKYQLQKIEYKMQYQITDLSEIVEFYKLRRLYRQYYHDNIKLIDITSRIFGLGNIQKKQIDRSMLSSYAFSKEK